MNNNKFIMVILMALLFTVSSAYAQNGLLKKTDGKSAGNYEVDYRIDAMKYWKHMAKLGLVEVSPVVPIKKAVYTSSKINGKGAVPTDSPDIPVTDNNNTTQSENSIFIDPNNIDKILNSNNSTSGSSTLYGTSGLLSNDGGQSWAGSVQGTGGDNSGDPATVIGNDGTYYVGHITNNLGQGIAYSSNQGQTWNTVQVAPPPGGFYSVLDKNHLWIDNSLSSPYEGNLYDAWTPFGGSNDTQIEFSRSTDGGLSWSSGISLSNSIAAGSHNQGVNINSGPNGEVYVVWTVYDNSGTDENAMGFAKSYDGGITFLPASRIISNIRGIRNSGTSKSMRVNSFPVMAVDISNGPYSGNIYVVWSNIGVPGINTGQDIDVYMIRSGDHGSTWTTPLKINQDASGFGKEHYFPWIACDPVTGTLSVVFYDDRNVSSSDLEVFVALSTNGGDTWDDFKVSDVSFTPSPIPGLATDYFGDYIGITARDRKVYPCWTDNRTGTAMTWVSPFETGPPPDQPYIVYNSHVIEDAMGNGNGRLDYGETVELAVAMANIGDEPAYNVIVSISSSDPFVEILDSTESYGNFNIGDTVTVSGAFTIQASDTIPDGHAIVFDVAATDGDSIWYSNFSIEAHAPGITIGMMTILDPTGNNNGRLDPGETADIHIMTANTGEFDLTNVPGTLSTTSSEITINTATYTFPSLLTGNASAAIFNITVDTGVATGTVVDLIYHVEFGLYSAQQTFLPKVGLILEDWETGNFSRFPWTDAGNAPWIISSINPGEGLYCAKSGNITHNQSSELYVNLDVITNDSISFLRKVSSEYSYDYLEFYIDNNLMDAWSGEEGWARVSFPVSAGNHTFKWKYYKDSYVSSGSDCAWIDYIIFPPLQTTSTPLSVTALANPQVICVGEPTQLYTYPLGGSGNYSYEWTPATGLSDPFIANPVATPIITTTYNVFVDDGTDADSAQLFITVNAKPIVDFDILADACVYWPPFLLTGGTPLNGIYTGTGVTNNYFDPSVAGTGTHTLTYTYIDPSTNCSDTALQTIVVNTCVGIGENIEIVKINIFPNPNTGDFTLELNSDIENTISLSIFDPVGILVYEENDIKLLGTMTKKFNFDDIAAGVYFLNVHSNDIRYVKRIVIQK
ncbi:MAG: T9SS type A sorting domain-containing protein [Bacteroidales bacterium]|nr:T9SS type A sorting domain-containing protein [Bacteroidales bacterium]